MSDYYESKKIVSEYIQFHFAAPKDLLPFDDRFEDAILFPAKCIERGLAHFEGQSKRALDLGCAVGRSSFELSKTFEEVVGIDFSNSLIAAANNLKETKSTSIDIAVEGELTRTVEARIPDGSHTERITFQQGDATQLSPKLGSFDFILMANLIDRLPKPAACIETICNFMNPGGLLMITSPYTWLEEFTPKQHWLGGYKKHGHEVRTIETLHKLLDPEFDYKGAENLPFFIREHERKNQFSFAEATFWQKH